MELLDHMVVRFLTFLGTSILFPIVAAQISFPSTVQKDSLFSTSLPTLLTSYLFDNSHSNRCDIALWFWLAFSWWNLFMYLFAMYVFFGKMSIQILCSFLNWTVWFFAVELCEFFVYFRYQPLIKYVIYVLSFIMLPFHFIDGFLCSAESF